MSRAHSSRAPTCFPARSYSLSASQLPLAASCLSTTVGAAAALKLKVPVDSLLVSDFPPPLMQLTMARVSTQRNSYIHKWRSSDLLPDIRALQGSSCTEKRQWSMAGGQERAPDPTQLRAAGSYSSLVVPSPIARSGTSRGRRALVAGAAGM